MLCFFFLSIGSWTAALKLPHMHCKPRTLVGAVHESVGPGRMSNYMELVIFRRIPNEPCISYVREVAFPLREGLNFGSDILTAFFRCNLFGIVTLIAAVINSNCISCVLCENPIYKHFTATFQAQQTESEWSISPFLKSSIDNGSRRISVI